MVPKTLLFIILVVHNVCEGFDFTFHPTSVNRTSDAVSAQGCGVLQCREMMPGGPADSRKILSLAVYTRGSSLDSQSRVWERLARVTAQSPREVKVSDAKHISGSLSDTAAQLRVTLLKASDCTSTEFSCVAKLGDDNGQTSEMKSVIRGSNLGMVEDSNLEPGVEDDGDLYGQSSEQSAIVRKVEHFMVKLSEKLKCIESRFSDSRDRDDKLEDKLEDLQEKIKQGIERSSDRIEDKIERMKDRLEDKLLQVSTGKTLYNVDNDSGCLCEACTNISAQMATVESSVNSMGTSLVSLTDQVRVVGQSMPNATALDHKLDTIITEVSGIATVTNNLTSGVQTQASTCAHQTPGPEDEFFDVLETGRREWRLAFRGTASNNVQIYPAYMNGTGIPTEVEAACKQFSMSLPCVNHYRNRVAIEKWAALVNVDQVLLALYEKGQIVKLIRFNGKGSTPTSWFEGQRVLQSSWTDLKTKSHNFFSIEGDVRFGLLRRFMVNHKYGGCPGDEGWLIVSDSVLPGGCQYEKKQAAPAFIYAKGSTAALWETQEVGRAEAMGIFIKYE